MHSFAFEQPPLTVTFRAGALESLPEALRACDASRPVFVPTPSQRSVAERAAALAGVGSAARFDGVLPHVPKGVVAALRAFADERRADAYVAIGGGAAIDLAKAASAATALQVIAIPTTYGGSELTRFAGQTDNGEKGRVVSRAPRALLYDPELTRDLSLRASAGSAMNALAHAVEALYAPGAAPLALLAAEEALRRIAPALRALPRDPRDLGTRTELLYGGYLGGVALAGSGMALHHRICHVLGGRYGIAHGDANAVILPHVVRFNASAASGAIEHVARALGTEDAATALATLARDAGAPTSLAELGLPADELGTLADVVLSQPLTNPRPVEHPALLALLADAWPQR